jgi:hypothetical protein
MQLVEKRETSDAVNKAVLHLVSVEILRFVWNLETDWPPICAKRKPLDLPVYIGPSARRFIFLEIKKNFEIHTHETFFLIFWVNK